MNLRPLKQSIDHWLWSLGGRDVNGHQAPDRKSRQNESQNEFEEYEVREK